MAPSLDKIDKRILYHLARDARRTSAPDITEDLDVSAATIRNRIAQLEDSGVIQGYHANIDYERTNGKLTYLFLGNSDTPRREYFAKAALEIPGVIHVREVMSGRRNLHIEAVGEDKAEITRIGRDLSNLGIDIEDEALVQREYHHAYKPFSPNEAHPTAGAEFTDLHELAGEAKVLDVTVSEASPAAGQTIRELSETDLLTDGFLFVAVERGDTVITPNGETMINSGDVITIFSHEGDVDEAVRLFTRDADPLNQSDERPQSTTDV